MRRLLQGLVLALVSAGPVAAQGVVVAPHAVYMDHRTRSGSITLYNPNTEPAEVTISSFFGYPVTDSVGAFMLAQPDSVDAGMPAATAWIDAFPKRVTIPPLQRQTIRLLARPPQGLADGEYWSRIMISAKGGSVPVQGVDSAANITIGLALEMRTIIPLLYRKGSVKTGLSVSGVQATRVADSVEVRARLERSGNAAWVGVARGTLADASGRSVATFERPIAVYYDVTPAFRMPAPAAGNYSLRLEFIGERPDIAPELLLKSAPVRDTVEVALP